MFYSGKTRLSMLCLPSTERICIHIRINTHKQPSVLSSRRTLDYTFNPAKARSNGSELQKSWSQPRNQPVKVGGSKPCFTVTIGVLLSLFSGSVSIYLAAGEEKTRIRING